MPQDSIPCCVWHGDLLPRNLQLDVIDDPKSPSVGLEIWKLLASAVVRVTQSMPCRQAVVWSYLVSDQVFFVQLRDRIAVEG